MSEVHGYDDMWRKIKAHQGITQEKRAKMEMPTKRERLTTMTPWTGMKRKE